MTDAATDEVLSEYLPPPVEAPSTTTPILKLKPSTASDEIKRRMFVFGRLVKQEEAARIAAAQVETSKKVGALHTPHAAAIQAEKQAVRAARESAQQTYELAVRQAQSTLDRTNLDISTHHARNLAQLGDDYTKALEPVETSLKERIAAIRESVSTKIAEAEGEYVPALAAATKLEGEKRAALRAAVEALPVNPTA